LPWSVMPGAEKQPQQIRNVLAKAR